MKISDWFKREIEGWGFPDTVMLAWLLGCGIIILIFALCEKLGK